MTQRLGTNLILALINTEKKSKLIQQTTPETLYFKKRGRIAEKGTLFRTKTYDLYSSFTLDSISRTTKTYLYKCGQRSRKPMSQLIDPTARPGPYPY